MRQLKKEEIELIQYMLLGKPEMEYLLNNLSIYFVSEMDDGGMGSLKVESPLKETRKYNGYIADIYLRDVDDIPLVITIYVDTDGDLYELDVWKADSTPLKEFPKSPYKPETPVSL